MSHKFDHVQKPLMVDLAQTISPPVCDDCDKPTDWEHAVQVDPFFHETGEILCENCAEKRYDRYVEYLLETT